MHATVSCNKIMMRLIIFSQVLLFFIVTACVDNSRVKTVTQNRAGSAGIVAKQNITTEPAAEELTTEVLTTEESAMRNDRPVITMVYGNNVWQPGWTFNDSNVWLALVCSAGACNLLPATLQVSASSWQGHYDYSATAGQKLSFKTRSSSVAITNVWFKRDSALSWLKPGAVQTYYFAFTSATQSDSDTYELTIKNSRGEQERLVPVLIADGKENILLQLRARGKQQLLNPVMDECYAQLGNHYLLWAGDLDADGETDYLINFIEGVPGSVSLYLSSLATGNNLVQHVGNTITDPVEGVCD
jgi:hypothetical protein